MQNTTFKVGDSVKHENGFIWEITEVSGKHLAMKSTSDNQTITAVVTKNDLNTMISLGFYERMEKSLASS